MKIPLYVRREGSEVLEPPIVGKHLYFYGWWNDVDQRIMDQYPYVLPLPDNNWVVAKWNDFGELTTWLPKYEVAEWAKTTVGSIHAHLSSQCFFFQFKTVEDLIMFKLRWNDDLKWIDD